MKNYLLILLSVMGIGLLFSPNLPINVDLENTETTSNMMLPELSEISEVNLNDITDVAKITSISNTFTIEKKAPAIRNYNVSINSASIVAHPSYQNIYRTGRLVYAHNSSNLFGNLKSLSINSVFTLTENGLATTYRVSAITIYEKNPTTKTLQLNGSGSYMRPLVENAMGHSVALMTCSGQSYGNGDASHRLVIFADKI